MRWAFLSISPKIVSRLRLVFIAISIVVISSIIVGFTQLRTADRASQRLTENSVPVLETARSLERNLKSLLSVLQLVGNIRNLQALAPIDEQLSQQLAALRQDVARLGAQGSSSVNTAEMSAALNEIANHADQIVTTKSALLRNGQDQSLAIAEIIAARDEIRKTLEDLTYTASVEFDTQIAPDQVLDQDQIAQLERRFYERLLQANILTELNLELESIAEFAIRLQEPLSTGEISRIERLIQLKVRDVTVLISQLPESQARLALARYVSKFRTAVRSQDGVIHRGKQINMLELELEEFQSDQLILIRDISSFADQLTDTARQDVNLASQQLVVASRRLELTLALGSLATLCFMLAASVMIVERQINRRMARLTHSVMTIAGGQTDFNVTVSGPDELGDIARALEVFKLNAEELRRSNTELQQFAYVAAHDLRSPLRAIRDLAEWTLEDTDNSLSEDGRQNLDMLISRTKRLDLLLNDLLEYARVGREEEHLSEVSMPDLIAEIATILNSRNRFNIRYLGNLDTVLTLATPLQQILMNLVSNSMKHHDTPTGTIEISARIIGDRLRVSVQDDGAGIDPKYHDRIFGLFQTLRPRDEVEGSGLGLAIIRKLIERYGGKIEIISNPAAGRGSEFIFDLPHRLYDSEKYKLLA